MTSTATKSLMLFARTLLLSLLLAGSAAAAETVNINTADAATLDRVLVNIGPAKAEAIVSYRKTNGPFRSADQLAQVPGIGLKTVEKNKDRIVYAGGAAPAPAAAAAAKPAVPNAQSNAPRKPVKR
jgi:competence protein ComEA